MSIKTELSADGKEVTIAVSGRFDFSNHQDFLHAYKDYPKGKMRFIVELSSTDYMDSSAMGMLLLLREHSSKEENSVVLINGNEAIREILRIANFNKLFTIR